METVPDTVVTLFLPKNRKLRKMQFFDQNYGLTSLEKIQKFDYI